MDEIENPAIRPFLLMEGGPLFTIQKRLGVIKEHIPFTKRRALIAALLTWFPLLILSAIQGRAFGNVPVPFIRDFGAYTRFLLAIPLLLLAENILGPRIAGAAEHFVTSGVVAEKDYQRFDYLVERGLLARDSILAEIIIALLAYCTAMVGYRSTAVHVSAWSATTHIGAIGSLTWAGWWLLLFCSPLFHFLILRWLWRLFLWFQFLARVRRLDLQLFPTHPDQAAGLGFVGEAQRFFGSLLFAVSIANAGVIANDIIYDKVPLKNFAPAIAAYVIIAIIIVIGPLIVFTGLLLRTKRIGLHQYGTLATTYSGSFHRKWIRHENPEHEPLLGTGDIQSLADLGNSYGYVEKMKPIPVDPRTLVHLVIASLLPLAPLLLAVMPLKEVLKLLLKVVM